VEEGFTHKMKVLEVKLTYSPGKKKRYWRPFLRKIMS
jgi:hypothetical protein